MANEPAHVLPLWAKWKGYKELGGREDEGRRVCISRLELYSMAFAAAGLLALGVVGR